MKNTRGKHFAGSATLLAALLCASCGGISKTGPSAGTPSLALNTGNVDFGNVALGNSKTQSITLMNTSTGSKTITVSAAAVSGAGFSVKPGSLPLTLAAGHSASISLIFTPIGTGSRDGNLSIALLDSGEPLSAVLAGNGTGTAKLTVSPASVSFGDVEVGKTAIRRGTIIAGTSDVTVSEAEASGPGFALAGISFPLKIPAGKSAPYSVIFTPDASGASSGSVSFVSDATNSPASQTLAGTATAAPTAQHSVSLTWMAATASAVGYNLYRAPTSGGPYAKLNAAPQSSTSYVDRSVEAGGMYFYVATAVDAGNKESGYSDEVTAQVPSP